MYLSALMASSPRTAYWTLVTNGLIVSMRSALPRYEPLDDDDDEEASARSLGTGIEDPPCCCTFVSVGVAKLRRDWCCVSVAVDDMMAMRLLVEASRCRRLADAAMGRMVDANNMMGQATKRPSRTGYIDRVLPSETLESAA